MKWFGGRKKGEFVCQVCGKSHFGLPTDYGHDLPDIVWALGPDARKSHLDWSPDICFYQDRWFIRGVLEIPFAFGDGRFGWGIWAEVSDQTMGRFYKLGNADGSNLAREKGTLANALAIYSEIFDLPVEIQFGPSGLRPTIFLSPEVTGELADDQRNGLSDEKYHQIADFLLAKASQAS